ncbi:MAG: DUF2914 domain-containing protein [Bacteroidota bacterium]
MQLIKHIEKLLTSLILLVLLLLNNSEITAQDEEFDENKISKKAIKYFNDDDLNSALPLFIQLYKNKPQDALYNFYLGTIYLELYVDKSKAIPFLEYACYNKPDIIPSSDQLSRAYHLTYQFDKAIEQYQEYLEHLPGYEKKEIAEMERRIEMCKNGKLIMQDTTKIKLENLGNIVNSQYPEYAPAISADEEVLIFTSRRPSSTGGKIDFYGEYFEDIYISFNKEGEWSNAAKISENINTKLHDASIGLSADAQQLFVYRKGDIYSTELEGITWTEPKKLGSNINTSGWETHATMTFNQQVLYFTSDRKGGFGGRDVYKAKKLPHGKWALVQNLGPNINTPYDEDAPFIHPDGKTLFFSSKGHNSMGGFDIFTSTFKDDEWTVPKNMGYPINTTDDDIYFVVSANWEHGFLAANRKEGFGEKDIYVAALPDTGKIPLTIIRGIITGKEGIPLRANFIVTDNETKEVVGLYNSNSATGKYLLVFPPGKNYTMLIRANGYTPHSDDIYIPDQDRFYELFQEIQLSPVQKADSVVGQKIVMRNAFFDIDQALEADKSLAKITEKEKAYSAFLSELETSNERDEIFAKVDDLEAGDDVKNDLKHVTDNYLPSSQIHIFDESKKENLEKIVLGTDTIYATSSSTASKVEMKEIDTTVLAIQPTIYLTMKQMEKELEEETRVALLEKDFATLVKGTEEQINELTYLAKRAEKLVGKIEAFGPEPIILASVTEQLSRKLNTLVKKPENLTTKLDKLTGEPEKLAKRSKTLAFNTKEFQNAIEIQLNEIQELAKVTEEFKSKFEMLTKQEEEPVKSKEEIVTELEDMAEITKELTVEFKGFTKTTKKQLAEFEKQTKEQKDLVDKLDKLANKAEELEIELENLVKAEKEIARREEERLIQEAQVTTAEEGLKKATTEEERLHKQAELDTIKEDLANTESELAKAVVEEERIYKEVETKAEDEFAKEAEEQERLQIIAKANTAEDELANVKAKLTKATKEQDKHLRAEAQTKAIELIKAEEILVKTTEKELAVVKEELAKAKTEEERYEKLTKIKVKEEELASVQEKLIMATTEKEYLNKEAQTKTIKEELSKVNKELAFADKDMEIEQKKQLLEKAQSKTKDLSKAEEELVKTARVKLIKAKEALDREVAKQEERLFADTKNKTKELVIEEDEFVKAAETKLEKTKEDLAAEESKDERLRIEEQVMAAQKEIEKTQYDLAMATKQQEKRLHLEAQVIAKELAKAEVKRVEEAQIELAMAEKNLAKAISEEKRIYEELETIAIGEIALAEKHGKEPGEIVKEPEEIAIVTEELVKEPEEITTEPEEQVKEPGEIAIVTEEQVKEPEEIIKNPEEKIKEPEEIVKKTVEPVKESKMPAEEKFIGEKVIFRNLFYDVEKNTLRSESIVELDRLLNLMKQYASLVIEISGHTCSLGEENYNQMLSKARAQVVVDYLTDHGISKTRLLIESYGESRPIASNFFPDGTYNTVGMQKNRRTEIKVIGVTKEMDISYIEEFADEIISKPKEKVEKKPPISAGGITVVQAATCRSVEDLTPMQEGTVFPGDIGRLYLFTKVMLETGIESSIFHVWYFGNKEMANIELPVKGPQWRTYSYKTIIPAWTGEWRVDVTTADKKVIKSVHFRIK